MWLLIQLREKKIQIWLRFFLLHFLKFSIQLIGLGEAEAFQIANIQNLYTIFNHRANKID